MSDIVIVAIWGFLGTAVGSISGILASSKLTAYRLERLEKKVEKHNNLVERVYIVEGDIKVIKNDIHDLKEVVHNEG